MNVRASTHTTSRGAAIAGFAVAVFSLIGLSGAALSTGQAAAAAVTPVHFGASGDFSGSANTSRVLTAVGAAHPDLYLALGDLSYSSTPNTESAWCDYVKARVGASLPFELVAGNHESNGENGNIDAFAACLPNRLPGLVGTYAKEYYVDVPAAAPLVRYIMISPGLTFPDGTWDYTAGSARYNWTAAAIDGAHAANIPWVVVGLHKPCLSMGAYTCDQGVALSNMFLAKKVDLVLNGHEHLYQRTKQLGIATGCTGLVAGSYNAACVRDSDATLVKGAGTVFATVGTSGVPIRTINTADSEAGYFAAYSASNANPTWGFLDVTASDTTMNAQFVRADGGTFADSFAITAATTPPATVLANDEFTRTVTSGWGAAPTGGAWSLTGTPADFRATGTTGQITTAVGATRAATLAQVSSTSSDTRASIALSAQPTGGGVYASVIGRRVGSSTYGADAWVRSDGTVWVVLKQGGTALASVPVSGIAGAQAGVTMRVRVTGTSPTTLQARIWRTGQAEPAAWQASATDSTAALQAPGSVGVQTYVSRSATAGTVVMIDNFQSVVP